MRVTMEISNNGAIDGSVIVESCFGKLDLMVTVERGEDGETKTIITEVSLGRIDAMVLRAALDAWLTEGASANPE